MLHSYNVATGVTTLVRYFTADLGGGYPVQWTRSMDDDVFAFTLQNVIATDRLQGVEAEHQHLFAQTD